MTIKKIKTAPQTTAGGAAAGGQKPGATIASRLKLDATDPAALKAATASKKATQFALTAAILGFVAAGLLTFVLYKHWEFLMPM